MRVLYTVQIRRVYTLLHASTLHVAANLHSRCTVAWKYTMVVEDQEEIDKSELSKGRVNRIVDQV